jgi:hypothetical protein
MIAYRRSVATTVGGLGLALGLVWPAAAVEITFAFEGTVLSVIPISGQLPGNIGNGDAMTGQFTFECDVDGTPGFSSLTYFGSPLTLQLNVESLTLNGTSVPDTNTAIQVVDDAQGSEVDSYTVVVLPGPPDIGNFSLGLTDPTPSDAIIGLDLPLVPPEISDFNLKSFSVTTTFGDTIIADLTSLTVVGDPVISCPEPEDGLLQLASLAALLLLRRRSHRCSPV